MRPAVERARYRRWLGLALLALLLGLYQAIAGWRERHALLINMSDSLPYWAFVLTRADGVAPVLGDTVFFEPPPGQVVTAHFGTHPAPFGKTVLGVPGQTVRHYQRLVTVDHRVVGWTKPRTRLGYPLAQGPQGVIPSGCYYVGSTHPDGLDSRYAAIGFVCRRQLLGTGTAIL